MSETFVMPQSVQSVFLELFDGNDRVGKATGFLAADNGQTYLVTNRHVLSGFERVRGSDVPLPHGRVPSHVRIHHLAADDDPMAVDWTPRVEACRTAAGLPAWKEHPDLGPEVDVVALPLSDLDGVGTEPYPVFGDQPALYYGPGGLAHVIGFPFGMSTSGEPRAKTAVWTTGYVASDPSIDFLGRPCFMIDARTRSGQSGSPVVAIRIFAGTVTLGGGIVQVLGQPPEVRLIGVYSGRFGGDTDLGVVWKLEALREILRG